MKRETRLNLIFLTIFLLFTLPGGVMLFIKKLDPTAHKMYLPDPVLKQVAYIVPLEMPPQVQRIVPPQTGAWVRDQAQQTGLPPLPPGTPPIVSATRGFELIALDDTPTNRRAAILIWDDQFDPATGQLQFNAPVASQQTVDLPKPVRVELQELGFIKPPRRLARMVLSLPPATDELLLTYRSADQTITDRLVVPLLRH